MSYVKEKVSYLRGLFDGMAVEEGPNGKLFAAMIDALDSIADAIDDSEATIDEMDECISDIYESLDELEEELYGDDEFDDDIDFDDDDFIEVECPHCGDIIYFDHDMLATKDNLICPSCNKKVIPAQQDKED